MISFKHIWILLLTAMLAFSCTPEVRQKLATVPNAFGSRNQIIVVADSSLWESAVGDTFIYYFASAYPVLPQPEPIFDLTLYTPQNLEEKPLRRNLRNYIFLADLDDDNSPTTQMVKKDLGEEKLQNVQTDKNASTAVTTDRWAKNQLIIYLYNHGAENLKEQIIRNFPAIKKRIDKANEPKVAANIFINGENKAIQNKIERDFGLKSRVPDPYFVAYDEEDVIWIRRETPVSSSNIMIHKMPYKSQDQLTREYLKSVRDSLGKKLVSTEIEGTFMQTNDVDLPMLVENKPLNGNYAIEARGIWEMVNDYMGGPFVSYLTINAKTNELYFIDGFIYAPSKEKREFMQNIEYVIQSLKFM